MTSNFLSRPLYYLRKYFGDVVELGSPLLQQIFYFKLKKAHRRYKSFDAGKVSQFRTNVNLIYKLSIKK